MFGFNVMAHIIIFYNLKQKYFYTSNEVKMILSISNYDLFSITISMPTPPSPQPSFCTLICIFPQFDLGLLDHDKKFYLLRFLKVILVAKWSLYLNFKIFKRNGFYELVDTFRFLIMSFPAGVYFVKFSATKS